MPLANLNGDKIISFFGISPRNVFPILQLQRSQSQLMGKSFLAYVHHVTL